MKKIIFGVLFLLLVIAGVFVFSIVRSFDVDSYKTKVVSTLETLTGRKVQFQDATLSWRPTPTFVMNDLLISNQDGATTPNMISVKQIQVQMGWGAFFGNDLEIKKILVKEPNVLVERLHTYQTNFSFPILFNPDYFVAETDIITTPDDIRIKSFEIENGSITYHNALTNQTAVLKGIYGVGKVDSMYGPFSFKGRVAIKENNLDIELETQKIEISKPFVGKIDISDSLSETQAGVSYVLPMTSDGDWLKLEGHFDSLKAPEFFNRFSDLKWPQLGELKGSFKATINPQEDVLEELVLVQDNEQESISFVLSITQDEKTKKDKLSVSLNQLDYGLWGDILKGLDFKNLLKSKSNIGLEVSVSQLIFNNQTIVDLLLQGDVTDVGLELTMGVKLPFDGEANFKGKYNLDVLNGNLMFKTSNLKSMIQWLDKQEKIKLPDTEILNAQLTGEISYSDKEQKLDIQSANVENVQILGKVERTSDALKTDLKIQDLNLDSYYPNIVSAEDGVVRSWIKDNLLKIWDIDKKIYFGADFVNLTVLQNNFENVLLNAKKTDKTWDIAQVLIKKKDDLDISFSGKITKLEDGDFAFDSANLDLNINDLNAYLKWMPFIIGTPLEKASSVSGNIIYSGDLKSGQIDTQLTLDSTQLSAKGKVDIQKENFENIQLKMVDDSLQKLVQLMTDKKISEKWDIPVDLNGNLSWNKNKKTWSDMTVLLNKDTFKTSGEWNQNQISANIHSNQMDLNLFLPDIDTLLTSKQKFNIPESLPNINLDVTAENFTYSDVKGKQLKLKSILQNQKLTLVSFDCLLGDEKPGRISANGTVEFDKMVKPDLKIELEKIPLNRQDLKFASYRFADGSVSGKIQVKSDGDSWYALLNSAFGAGQMSWQNGLLYGVDASAWLNAVQSSLMAEQLGQGFSTRLKYAFENGKTSMPDLNGDFILENGTFNFADIQGKNDLIILSGGKMEFSPVSGFVQIKMPIILTALSKLPAVVVELDNRSYNIQSVPFEQAFDEELRLKNNQTQQARQMQNLRDTENKNKQMRSEAQKIMTQMEQTLKQLQDRVDLRGGANKKQLDELNYIAREIRELAVKTDLMPSEYERLLEKAKLWAVQVNELNNTYARQDLLTQKAKTTQLSGSVSNYLSDMERYFQQYPQSVILAEIVMNSRHVADLIKTDEKQLSVAQDSQTAQSLILRIQENFTKIEKAHQYAQQIYLSLMNGGGV
ncbi:MAG: AsmA family protein [Alphaproteobacteria bacterium]|nr:AsmA family protein [Alphaproteobacteria bacterium]